MKSNRRQPSAIESLESRRLLAAALDVAINFAPKRVPGVSGYLPDVGNAYGDRGDGLTFGWNASNSANHRDRNVLADQRLDTNAALQIGGNKRWEIAVPAGQYSVTVTAGDARYVDSVNVINVEGTNVVKTTPSKASPFNTKTKVVTVTDGKLTVRAGSGAQNAKIVSIALRYVGEAPEPPPSVTATAIDATAAEGNADTGLIRLTRTGDLSASLLVNLAWSGSAGKKDIGSDRPSSLTFGVGQSTIDVPVVAKTDALAENTEAAWLTVVGGTGYTIGAPAAAAVLVTNVTPEPDPEPEPEPEPFSNISWAGTVSPPVTYTEQATAVVNGKMYAVGGYNSTFNPQSVNYEFNGTSWTTKASAPRAFTHSAAAAVDNTIWFVGGYIGTGNGGQTIGDARTMVYTPATDTWSDGPSLPAARASGGLAQVGRKVYHVGGEDLNRVNSVATVYAIDLDNLNAGWQTVASLPAPRLHASVIPVDGKIYLLGGQVGHNTGLTTHDDIFIYNPTTDSWTTSTKKLPAPASQTTYATVLARGKILIQGGQSTYTNADNNVWAIDPVTLDATVLGDFPDARFSSIAGVVGDKVYVFGGYRGFIANQPYVGTFVA